MKILQVSPRYPPQSGGVETHVKEISERLVDRGHEVTVVTADRGADSERRGERNGVRIRRYRSLAPNNAMHICPQIATAVRPTDADIVHAHNYHSFPLVFAAVSIGDRRFIATTHYHGASASSIRDRLLSLYQPVGRWALRRAETVIAVSEWERDQLETDFGVDATVIPNGIETERFAGATAVVRDRPYLLTVGRLEAYKGVQHVIRAMSELPEYDLLIAGSGDYRKQLQAVANDEGVTAQVEFLGYVADEELPRLYAGADVYVTMSEFESYGLTVTEALAAGTPTVVNRVGALQEWCRYDACVGVDGTDSETLAAAIRTGAERERNTAPVPDWERVVDELGALYESTAITGENRT
jgi:glycosyltransferase involved in cell wall biosynthesis